MYELSVAMAVLALLLRRQSLSLHVFLALPATLAHELAHWLVALLAGCRPGLPALWPRKVDGRWVLGSVTFDIGFWSAGLVALAPLWLLGSLVLWMLSGILADTGDSSPWVRGLVLGYGVWASFPSSTDWLVAVRHPIGSIVALTVFSFALAASGIVTQLSVS